MFRKEILLLALLSVAPSKCNIFNFNKLYSYVKIFDFDATNVSETSNELWRGILKDCSKKVTFSCIQKNAYTYLDDTLSDRDNITVFDGLVLTKNNLDYGSCKRNTYQSDINENLVEGSTKNNCESELESEDDVSGDEMENRELKKEQKSPLEEITTALRRKTTRFLATRDYKIHLPDFFFEGATIKISPREVDESGGLFRVDFGSREVERGARIFKKIKKFIQNKLLVSFLALLLLIKLIKVKFMFVIPFLFGVGTAKKLFLKLLLFFIPAFAHIFKLCSSYYTIHGTKYHHHHHQIAHHHHHVPVPVPVPAYLDHHHHHHEDDFDGYDYTHPHIQYRKDIEELKEWGIEPYEEPYEDVNQHLSSSQPVPGVLPAPLPATVAGPLPGPTYSATYGLPQYAPNARPVAAAAVAAAATGASAAPYSPSSNYAHNLAYSAYRPVDASAKPSNVLVPTATIKAGIPTSQKNHYNNVFAQQQNIRQRVAQPVIAAAKNIPSTPIARKSYDDEYFGPIISRLEEIFVQLRFFEESCRERLVCSMYKSPTVYSPHSNLVSNELSRDPQELKLGAVESASSKKFHRYLNAARIGQERGDCLRTFPCHINTE